jgi:hypothetical protein
MTGLRSETISDYLRFYRELVASTLEDEQNTIGGPNIVIEIDETKLGKRKYNRGHCVDGVWVMSGVEKTPERKVFIEIIEDRSANTLLDVISRHKRRFNHSD